MHSIITSYLLQSKECVLPGIGSLQIIDTPAATANEPGRILPPSSEIIFKRNESKKLDGQVNYIAAVSNIPKEEAEDRLNDFCKEWKHKINNGESLHLETIGFIKKNGEGDIVFEKEETINFYEPIEVDQIYKSHTLPAVEAEVHVAKEEIYVKEKVVIKRSYWWLWALILLAIAAVMIFYHFSENGFNRSTLGNQNKIKPGTTQETYKREK